MEHPEAPPEGMEAAQLLRQNNGSLAGALFDAARSRAPDIAAAIGGIAMRGSGGRSAMGRTAAAAEEGGGPLYEVGTYNQLRGTPVPETTVHHVLSRLRGQELIADFATDRMAGTEFAIRLPASEADAVDAAVFRRAEISSGARQELAWQIRDLRNFSNAPNNALQELIDRNRVRRPWDFNVRGNR
jgi:hypothetical protein